jgi:hypothetical protein
MYKLYKTTGSEVFNAVTTVSVEPQKSFLFDENNPDYKEYLAWVAEGNVAEEWNPNGN